MQRWCNPMLGQNKISLNSTSALREYFHLGSMRSLGLYVKHICLEQLKKGNAMNRLLFIETVALVFIYGVISSVL